jgi:hypothetical protein
MKRIGVSAAALICATLVLPRAAAAQTTPAIQVPIPKTAADVPGPVPGNTMTNTYVQLVGRMAYVWTAIAANTPVRLAVELGASRVIILPTGYACALKEPPTRAIGKALHAITLMIAWAAHV